MQTGIIRRRGERVVIGRWRADCRAIVVETEDSSLRAISAAILSTPQTIPVHAPERHEFASPAVSMTVAPSQERYLALVALELEAKGFEMIPDDV
jgi:hypothetical protein